MEPDNFKSLLVSANFLRSKTTNAGRRPLCYSKISNYDIIEQVNRVDNENLKKIQLSHSLCNYTVTFPLYDFYK